MATREDYNSRFAMLGEAVNYENRALSIGDERLPPFARAVRDDNTIEPAPEYWDWLIESYELEDLEAAYQDEA